MMDVDTQQITQKIISEQEKRPESNSRPFLLFSQYEQVISMN